MSENNLEIKSGLFCTFDTVTQKRSQVMEFANKAAATRSFKKFLEEKQINQKEMLIIQIGEIDYFGNIQYIMPIVLSEDGNQKIELKSLYETTEIN